MDEKHFCYICQTLGESNGKLPLSTCPGCSIPGPHQSPD